jgi:hypothetical protein
MLQKLKKIQSVTDSRTEKGQEQCHLSMVDYIMQFSVHQLTALLVGLLVLLSLSGAESIQNTKSSRWKTSEMKEIIFDKQATIAKSTAIIVASTVGIKYLHDKLKTIKPTHSDQKMVPDTQSNEPVSQLQSILDNYKNIPIFTWLIIGIPVFLVSTLMFLTITCICKLCKKKPRESFYYY